MTDTLDDLAQDYCKADQSETTSRFIQGQVVIKAIDQGYNMQEVCSHFASMVRKSGRTVFRRYSVAKTFQVYDASQPWELYAVAASAVDYRWTDDAKIAEGQMAAQQWAERAIIEEWSTDELRQKMRGRERVKPIKLLDKVQVRVLDRGRDWVTLQTADSIPGSVEVGTCALVTMLLKADTQVEKSEDANE